MLIESGFPDVPIVDQPFYELLFENLQAIANNVALVEADSGGVKTVSELKTECDKLAGALQGLGLRKGEVVLLALPNSSTFVLSYLASLALGCVVTCISPDSTADELAERIRDCEPSTLFCTAEVLQRIWQNQQLQIMTVIYTGVLKTKKSPSWHPLEELTDSYGGSSRPSLPSIAAKTDLALLLYTSGTTGKPRGCMISHHNLVAAHRIYADSSFLTVPTVSDTVLMSLPLHQPNQQLTLTYCIRKGATVVLVDKQSKQMFLHAIQKHKVTYIPMTPPQLTWLSEDPAIPRQMLQSVRVVVLESDHTSKHVIGRFRDAYPWIEIVVQTYGMTETTTVSHALMPAKRYMTEYPDAIGYLLANSSCRIVNLETGTYCEEGEVGELWIKSPTNMLGYWRQPLATEEAFDSDGYFKTDGYCMYVCMYV